MTVKVIGISNVNMEKLADFLQFEKSWIEKEGYKKVLILHYLLTAFGGNAEEIESYEKKGYGIYTIEPEDIGGTSGVKFKEPATESVYRIKL